MDKFTAILSSHFLSLSLLHATQTVRVNREERC